MAHSLTNFGQLACLMGTATPDGAIANRATSIRLYDSSSTPAKDGTGFVQVAGGNGYSTGGFAITRADWTPALDTGDEKITLANKVVTATGPISNIAGAYIVDVSNNVLAWWEKASPITMGSGDVLTLNALSLKLT